MPKTLLHGALVLLAISAMAGGLGAIAQEKAENPPAKAAGPRGRILFFARHAPAADLAKTIKTAFADDPAGEVQVAIEPVGNVLVISVPVALEAALMDTLGKLDRAPKQIYVDLWLVELRPAAGEPLAALSDKADKLTAELAALEKGGKLALLNHIQLATLDNQPCKTQLGERRPVVRSTTVGGFGGGGGPGVRSSNVSFENLGTSVALTPRISGDNSVVMELSVEKSFPGPGDDAAVAAAARGEEVRPSGSQIFSANTTLALREGQVVQFAGQAKGGPTASDLRVLVTVRIGAEK